MESKPFYSRHLEADFYPKFPPFDATGSLVRIDPAGSFGQQRRRRRPPILFSVCQWKNLPSNRHLKVSATSYDFGREEIEFIFRVKL